MRVVNLLVRSLLFIRNLAAAARKVTFQPFRGNKGFERKWGALAFDVALLLDALVQFVFLHRYKRIATVCQSRGLWCVVIRCADEQFFLKRHRFLLNLCRRLVVDGRGGSWFRRISTMR